MNEILQALKTAVLSTRSRDELYLSIAARLRVKYVFGVSSGRAALWLILRSLQHLHPERDVVAFPAYTCFSVPAAVVRAGLKMHLLEIDPQTLDFIPSELGALPDKRLLGIIACNLFGFPNDLRPVREAAQTKGAYVIDDAAQALGAISNGRFVGTLGDVGFYSLGRGKAVGSIEGGLITTDSDEIARAIQMEAAKLQAPPWTHGAWLFLRMLSYSMLLRPRLFWIPNSLPFLKLGITEFKPSFPADEMHALCLGLLPQLFDHLSEVNEVRRANARIITEALAGNVNFDLPSPARNSRPTFIRLPILAQDCVTRQRAIHRFHKKGIGASSFYPNAICDVPGIESFMADHKFHRKCSEMLSQRLFTLPVHPFVASQDLARMIEILNAF